MVTVLILTLTVVLSLGFGTVLGYGIITGILNAFGRKFAPGGARAGAGFTAHFGGLGFNCRANLQPLPPSLKANGVILLTPTVVGSHSDSSKNHY